MDDRQAQFFTLVGEVSDTARMASLDVVLRLDDGSELRGVPAADPDPAGDELDETGFRDRLCVGDAVTPLSAVAAFTILRPE